MFTLFKFLKKFYFPIILVLFCFSLPFLPYNHYAVLFISIISLFFISFIINEYLSEIIPATLHKVVIFFAKLNPFIFNVFFTLCSLAVWNFSLYLPDKIFNIFTVALVFIPNFFNKNNRLNEVFKILLIYVALQFLEHFKLGNLIPGMNKYAVLMDSSNNISINKVFISVFEAVLYTKFYFFSLKILDECIYTTYKDK